MTPTSGVGAGYAGVEYAGGGPQITVSSGTTPTGWAQFKTTNGLLWPLASIQIVAPSAGALTGVGAGYAGQEYAGGGAASQATSASSSELAPIWDLAKPGNPWDAFVTAVSESWIADILAGNKNLTGLNILHAASLGIGTQAPSDAVHITTASASTIALRIENAFSQGVAIWRNHTDSYSWQLSAGSSAASVLSSGSPISVANCAYFYDETASQIRVKFYPNGTVNFSNVPIFPSDTAAGQAGLSKGDWWTDAFGNLKGKM